MAKQAELSKQITPSSQIWYELIEDDLLTLILYVVFVLHFTTHIVWTV